jgi:signal transduction histidine kinase
MALFKINNIKIFLGGHLLKMLVRLTNLSIGSLFFGSVMLAILLATSSGAAIANENDDPSFTIEPSQVEMVENLYNSLQTGAIKEIYKEIEDLKNLADSQTDLKKFQTLKMLVHYYFWLDDRNGILENLAAMKSLGLDGQLTPNVEAFYNLYSGYADLIEDRNRKKSLLVFEAELAKSISNGDLYSQAEAYELIGVSDAFFGNYYASLEKLYIALDTIVGVESLNAERIRVGIYLSLAFVYTSIDDVENTIGFYTKALEVSQAKGLAVDRGSIIYNIGFLLLTIDELELSEKFFQDLITYYNDVGAVESTAYPYYVLAFIYNERGDYQTAQNWAEKAYVRGKYISDFEGSLLQLIAENSAWLGDIDKANEYLAKADAYFEEFPDYQKTTWAARSIKVRAVIAHVTGRNAEAIKLYEEFHRAYYRAQNKSFTKYVNQTTDNFYSRLSDQRVESELLQQKMSLDELSNEKQANLNLFIAFLFLLMVGLVLFQIRWGKILKLSKLDAEQASRSKSEFLAQMSHELRTPLNAIIGFSEMMSKEVLGEMANKKYKDYVILINQSGLHLLRIINDILDISKVESGKIELYESRFDLCVLIEETVATMQNRAAKVGLEIINTAPDKCSLLYADRRIVKQIMFNILSNSIKFTPKGGQILINYVVGTSGEIIIEISDNGQGMSPEDLAQAMEPFGQVKSVMVQSHEGTGLGLPLVKAFMELHQGGLAISSILGEGTKVELNFPCYRVV